MINSNLIEIFQIIVLVFCSIVLHEIAHGFAAYLCGDQTAKNAGRLSLNPLKHIDPVGTVLLPGVLLFLRFMGMPVFLFGWAKPVPVNFAALRNPRRDMMIVGAAGPLTNILIAFLLARLMPLVSSGSMRELFRLGVFFNLVLACFNLIPIPPLDGSRIVAGLLPLPLLRAYTSLERYGIPIVFVLIYLGLFERVLLPCVLALGNFLGVNLT